MLPRPDLPAGPGSRRALAVVSVHASPLSPLGAGENGGMNLSIRRLCAGLAERGVPSDVFIRRDDPHAPAEELIAGGSRLVRLSAGPPEPLPKETVLGHLPAFTSALLAHAESERREYRLVHSLYWLSGWVARRAVQRWQVPWVHSFHTLARTKAAVGLPEDPVRAEVEAVLALKADRLVAGSSAEERDLARLYGAGADRVCVVPLGVDMEDFAPRSTAAVRARLGLRGDRVILYVGRLERLKGADTLIEAVAELLRRPGFDGVRVLMVGGDSGDGLRQADHPDGERGRLEAMAAERGLLGRLDFLGPVAHAELADLYALADVCVVPSRTESFGLVALEAQASGTPVVAARVGGLPTVVADGDTGVLVDGHDPQVWAKELGALLDDPLRRRRLGAAAAVGARRFGWDATVDALLDVYTRAIADRPLRAMAARRQPFPAPAGDLAVAP